MRDFAGRKRRQVVKMERAKMSRFMMVQKRRRLISRLRLFARTEAGSSSGRKVTVSSRTFILSCCRHCSKLCHGIGTPIMFVEDSEFPKSLLLKRSCLSCLKVKKWFDGRLQDLHSCTSDKTFEDDYN